MSWTGFKKNVGRATTQVMMKTGHVERTSNREYEVEERRYRTLESASLRLQKEAKGYLDSLRAMTASQMRIAETIDAFYGDSGASDGVSRSYKQAVEDLDAETVKALDGPYRSVPFDLKDLVWDEEKGVVDEAEVKRIEWEMNCKRKEGNPGVLAKDLECYGELMDYVYRATVLEPINRFCAYFPDINECIKKRQHKMLDYDSMRAKVKKLTEKPDKDPGKLPRTEKEADMVGSNPDFFACNTPPNTSTTPLPRSSSSLFRRRSLKRRSLNSPLAFGPADEMDFTLASPPKALNGIRQRAGLTPPSEDQEDGASTTTFGGDDSPLSPSFPRGRLRRRSGLARSSSLLSRYSSLLSPYPASDSDSISPTKRSLSTRLSRQPSELSTTTSCGDPLIIRKKRASGSTPGMRGAASSPYYSTPWSGSGSIGRSGASSRFGSGVGFGTGSSPWFEPSELEDIMRSLREEFIRNQADDLEQAKAAYLQLNDQLTAELPQLIDLRVPYLDPTFEALVKIQLRFCAEAYSRMAQVQQYLDASTRDQYASGDLDARVEDVLGQIRELSIAGTV